MARQQISRSEEYLGRHDSLREVAPSSDRMTHALYRNGTFVAFLDADTAARLTSEVNPMATKSKAKGRAKSTATKGRTAQPKRGAGKGKSRRTTTADDVKVQEETGVVGARAMDQKEAVALNSRHVAVRNGSESDIGPEGDRPESADGETDYNAVYSKVTGGEPGTLAAQLREEGGPVTKAAPARESAKARTAREEENRREAGMDGNERGRRFAQAFTKKQAEVSKRVQNLTAVDLFSLLGRDSSIESTPTGVRVTRGMAGANGRHSWQGATLADAVASMILELEVGPRPIDHSVSQGTSAPS